MCIINRPARDIVGRGRGGGGKRQTDIGTGVWKETRAGEGLCASTKN